MRKKSVLTTIGGIIIVAVAAWLGIDLNNNSSSDSGASGGSGAGSTSASAASAARLSTPSGSGGSGSGAASGGKASGGVASGGAASSTARSDNSNVPTCPLNSLPPQADNVVDDILAGGPFDYPADDGIHFGNYERVLPRQKSSYYREYTVETPGVGHRGARRIVVGGGTETDPDVWYYTNDHYESFCKIPDAEE